MLLILVIAACGVAVDQITKALALAHLTEGQPIPVVSDLLQLQILRNPGAAFGTGTSLTLVFAILAVVALGGVVIFVVPKVKCTVWAITVGLGVAGIAGNLLDRIFQEPGGFRGHVIDFLALKYFAVFNVADVALTAAAIMFVVITVFLQVDLTGHRLASAAAATPESTDTDTDGDPRDEDQ